MDDVSCFSINYSFIRTPAKKSNNILSYAAKIFIKIKEQVYLIDEDFPILDFALALREWRKSMRQNLDYYPMDDEALFMRFIYDKDKYIIEIPQRNMSFQLMPAAFFAMVDKFLFDFDNDLKKFKDCLSRYQYTLS